MPEQLGEAVLVLRTDDSGLDKGIGSAEGKARALGGTFDQTSASAGRLSQGLATTSQAAAASGAQFQRTSTQVTAAAGAQRAGMQQLTMNIGDVFTMYALGARPAQIFSSQIGQITQAIQLMTGGTSGLAKFLMGPWGIAMIIAAQAGGPLIGMLFSGADAAEELEKRMSEAAEGADAFGDAQTLLGKVMDLTTGKMKSQVDTLKALIRYTAELWKIQGREAQEAAGKQLTTAGERRVGGFGPIAPGGTNVGQVPPERAANPALQGLTRMVTGGLIGADRATAALGRLKDKGEISEDVYVATGAALTEFFKGGDKREAGEALLRAVKGEGIDPRLRQDGPKRRQRSGEDRYDKELDRLEDEQLQLQSQLTGDVRQRAGVEHDRIDAATAAYRDELDGRVRRKELSAEQAKTLLTAREANAEDQHALVNRKLDADLREAEIAVARDLLDAKLFALQGELANAHNPEERRRIQLAMLDAETEHLRWTLQQQLEAKGLGEEEITILKGRLSRVDAERNQRAAEIERKTNAQLLRESEAADRDLLDARLSQLQGELDTARTQGERRRIRLEMLTLETESLRRSLERQKREGDLDDADKQILQAKLDRLDAERDQRAAGIERETMRPFDTFLDGLPQTIGEIGEAFEQAAVNGIEDFNRGLAEAIVNGESLGNVLHRVMQRFLADLIEIQLKALEASIFGSGGGSGGLFGSLIGAIFGTVGGAGSSVTSAATAHIGPGRARGGPISPGTLYPVNEESTAPGLFFPLAPGIIEPPSAGYAAPDGGSGAGATFGDLNVYVSGARGNTEIREMVSAGVRQGIAGYDRIVGERVKDHLARRE